MLGAGASAIFAGTDPDTGAGAPHQMLYVDNTVMIMLAHLTSIFRTGRTDHDHTGPPGSERQGKLQKIEPHAHLKPFFIQRVRKYKLSLLAYLITAPRLVVNI
jgi:hypothetical protein